jgi:hypothetical protein
MTHHVDMTTVTLKKGGHDGKTPGDWCVMEAAAYFAHEPWSDHPECVSPVIGAFLRRWNDDLDDDGRQMLVPYIAKVVGTNTGAADDTRRAWMATDWMVRTYLPAWLRLAKLEEQAAAVEALPELVGPATWRGMESTVLRVRKAADAAWAAAWAAGDAAWDAARDAARDAAWDAAWDAARAAAGDAAWAAAWDAARDAAGAAARAAAGDAAWTAARAAARPTVKGLQVSALALLDRMVAVGQPTP